MTTVIIYSKKTIIKLYYVYYASGSALILVRSDKQVKLKNLEIQWNHNLLIICFYGKNTYIIVYKK